MKCSTVKFLRATEPATGLASTCGVRVHFPREFGMEFWKIPGGSKARVAHSEYSFHSRRVLDLDLWSFYYISVGINRVREHRAWSIEHRLFWKLQCKLNLLLR
jgi:hypothetical protein